MSGSDVHVKVDRLNGGTLVTVSGVVDALALAEVSTALTDAQRDHTPVFVDLAGVSFMDSRGLGALLAANERSREGAAPICIYRPSTAVRRLLQVSGVEPILREVEELPG